jgi:hypothetical protein
MATIPDFTSAPKDFRGPVSTLASKPAVRLATAAALAANTRTGNVLTADANGAMDTVDGVAPAVGDRILVMDEVADENNGIYEVTSLGGASAPFVLTRSWDFELSAQVAAGCLIYVEEGTANGAAFFFLSTENPITLNTTSLTFAPADTIA